MRCGQYNTARPSFAFWHQKLYHTFLSGKLYACGWFYMVTNDYTGIYAYVRIPNLLEYSAITRTTFDHSMVWSLYVHYSDNHIFTAGLILHTDHRLAHIPCTCQIARCFTLTACMGLLFWSSISSSHSDLVIFRVGFLFLLPPADGFTIPIGYTVPCGDT